MGTSLQPSADTDLDLDSIKAWVAAHSRQLIIGGAVVIVGGAGILFARQASRLKNERAEAAYATAQNSFYSGNRTQAKTELEQLVSRYPGTNGGTLGGMLLAQVSYGDGKYDDGIKGLQQLLGEAPTRYHAMIEELIAAGYADSKRPQEAADHYLKAADVAEFPADQDSYRADAARLLEIAGKADSAKGIWSKLAANLDSPVSTEAKVRLGELEAKPAAP
ncbi:MAG TPA: tetratricopeptide repeat protein [Gemmatimonadaceae bacterium]|nr:tetratricopeptide repeat protein [Gemmatimonadaceae bacterium]